MASYRSNHKKASSLPCEAVKSKKRQYKQETISHSREGESCASYKIVANIIGCHKSVNDVTRLTTMNIYVSCAKLSTNECKMLDTIASYNVLLLSQCQSNVIVALDI